MAVTLYPKTISKETIPKANGQYSFRFRWTTTVSLTERNILDAFAVVEAYFKEHYPIRFLRTMGKYPGEELMPEIQFIWLGTEPYTLNQIWTDIKREAREHYLDFSLSEVMSYEAKFPWWLLGLLGLGILIIGEVYKKK